MPPKNFVMSGARYSVSGLRITGEDGVKRVNRNHPIYKQFFNIAMQEITDMAQAVNVMLKCDINGVPIIETSEDGNMSLFIVKNIKILLIDSINIITIKMVKLLLQ